MANDFTARVAGISVELGMSVQNKSGIWCKPNMIEQSLLCKVLDAPDLEILHSNGVIEEMFLTCKDEIHFIIEHYNSYKQMPDKLTFLGRFKDFQMLEVTESTLKKFVTEEALERYKAGRAS